MSQNETKKKTFETDFHSHLLPDIDCSAPVDLSAELLNNMWIDGIRNVVLSPHFYPHWHNNVENFIEKRNAKIENLVNRLKENGLPYPELFPAAEVLLCPGLDKLEGLELLCIKGTKTLLIEMPDPNWSEALLESLDDVRKLGYDIVVAHVDRYGKENAEMLINEGYAVQLNADSVCSFGKSRMCVDFAKREYVFAVGSDTHVSSKGLPQYKKMCKAAGTLSNNLELINSRMLRLIGKN